MPRRRSGIGCEARDGGTEMRRGVVPEFDDAGMAIEGLLHDAALDTAAAAVHQTHFMEPGGGRRLDELGDHRRDVPRREGVQIELALDGNAKVARHN